MEADNTPLHEGNTMRATQKNMRLLCLKHNQPIAVLGVLAYSFETGETFSASSGDYFMLGDDECLVDSEGNQMVLVKEVRSVVMQEIED
jgi:hypothetical protein